ncbi:MAG: hypothetical protein NVSMB9_01500 [Isosphaeraceae bacterium]
MTPCPRIERARLPDDPTMPNERSPERAGLRKEHDPRSLPEERTVEISDTQAHLDVDPEEIAFLAREVLRGEGVARASISVALVDDATIQAINRRHLDHDWPTDVISFRLSEPDETTLCGELVVSAETAAATAVGAGLNARDELALYIIHGLLHLCGHDDKADSDREAMRRREGEILARLGLSNTFHAATGTKPLGAVPSVEGRDGERVRWSV